MLMRNVVDSTSVRSTCYYVTGFPQRCIIVIIFAYTIVKYNICESLCENGKLGFFFVKLVCTNATAGQVWLNIFYLTLTLYEGSSASALTLCGFWKCFGFYFRNKYWFFQCTGAWKFDGSIGVFIKIGISHKIQRHLSVRKDILYILVNTVNRIRN